MLGGRGTAEDEKKPNQTSTLIITTDLARAQPAREARFAVEPDFRVERAPQTNERSHDRLKLLGLTVFLLGMAVLLGYGGYLADGRERERWNNLTDDEKEAGRQPERGGSPWGMLAICCFILAVCSCCGSTCSGYLAAARGRGNNREEPIRTLLAGETLFTEEPSGDYHLLSDGVAMTNLAPEREQRGGPGGMG